MNKTEPTIAVCLTSLGANNDELKNLTAAKRSLGRYFKVKICGDIKANDIFGSRSVSERLNSVNWAAKNGNIIMAWNGGYNSIELLFDFAKINIPEDKVFVGYSDNTILANALPAKNICRGWQGPMLASYLRYPQYAGLWAECLYALFKNDYTKLTKLYNQVGAKVYQAGLMSGKVWGGNNYTFDLLQGTEFAPSLKEPFILLLEGEDFVVAKDRIWQDFIRNLDSVMLLPGAMENIQGLLIGKFPASYKINTREVEESLRKRKYLKGIPIIYDFPRGYGQPALYLPIGEEMEIEAKPDNSIKITKL